MSPLTGGDIYFHPDLQISPKQTKLQTQQTFPVAAGSNKKEKNHGIIS